ncbi:hypothetical protein chiPu_0027304, partial [Chiloscyllium punctatum]|nr:hypothetical protein [Chiloscyllium punctatum]
RWSSRLRWRPYRVASSAPRQNTRPSCGRSTNSLDPRACERCLALPTPGQRFCCLETSRRVAGELGWSGEHAVNQESEEDRAIIDGHLL